MDLFGYLQLDGLAALTHQDKHLLETAMSLFAGK
jgi:hypothetical protein